MKVLNNENKEIKIDFVKISLENLNKLNDILMQSPYQFASPIVSLVQSCINDTIEEQDLVHKDENNFDDKKA